MFKVLLREKSMVGQAQLLVQSSSYHRGLFNDTALVFNNASSSSSRGRGNLLSICFSSRFSVPGIQMSSRSDSQVFCGSLSVPGTEISSRSDSQVFCESSKVSRRRYFCTYTPCSRDMFVKPCNANFQTKNVRVKGSLMQRCGLRVEAARQDVVDEGGTEECEAVSGSIHLIVGPMFAGKTTALLERVEAEASAGRRVALVKSDKDTRYGLSSVVSHDGRHMPCWAVPSLASFRSQIGEEKYAKLDIIGIDEAQFLKDLYSFCQAAADYEGKTLIVAGLDGDFERNKFGGVLDLIPLADSIVKLSAHCELCGKPASFTFRKIDNRNKEVIGGTDIYMPVCRQHYYSGQVALEATRTVLDNRRFLSLQTDNVEINHQAPI
ncbi:hypothetical protein KP509_25G016400 [Ceratopteris richardii]|uniref:thymidine kinase n=1 Tax=Ceratopteris richardii TaxID=49495 RepID=A0A8T2RPE4_CERRI|nr:hypothetical protein KP509_25G016400 [Ceratopteris richardii]